MARRWAAKKRSIHLVCEHFELFSNTARGAQINLTRVLINKGYFSVLIIHVAS
jgi:hypothetical protein